MKEIYRAAMAVVVGATMLSGVAVADEYVRGYVKKDGTYVAPHMRSSPNSSKVDNWSSKGNYNPYTGEKGTKDPYKPAKPKF